MKRTILLFATFFALSISTQAQTDDEIYYVMDENPSYPTGDTEMLKFIDENRKDISKKMLNVMVSFVVEKNGTLSDVKVVRGSDDEAVNQEAIRVVKKMPRWKPGKIQGRTVRGSYMVPVRFMAEPYSDREFKISQAEEFYQAVHNNTSKAATFSEGDADAWAARNFRVPRGLKPKNDIRLYVYFLLEDYNKICNVRMVDMNIDNYLEPIPPLLEAEVNRLLRIMPRWDFKSPRGIMGGFMLTVKAQ